MHSLLSNPLHPPYPPPPPPLLTQPGTPGWVSCQCWLLWSSLLTSSCSPRLIASKCSPSSGGWTLCVSSRLLSPVVLRGATHTLQPPPQLCADNLSPCLPMSRCHLCPACYVLSPHRCALHHAASLVSHSSANSSSSPRPAIVLARGNRSHIALNMLLSTG